MHVAASDSTIFPSVTARTPGTLLLYGSHSSRALWVMQFAVEIPTDGLCQRGKIENYNSNNDQLFRNVWIAQSAEKLQLYKLFFLLENN